MKLSAKTTYTVSITPKEAKVIAERLACPRDTIEGHQPLDSLFVHWGYALSRASSDGLSLVLDLTNDDLKRLTSEFYSRVAPYAFDFELPAATVRFVVG